MSDKERELVIAEMLADGLYTWREARLQTLDYGLNLDSVESEYARIYEKEQCANEGYYHD